MSFRSWLFGFTCGAVLTAAYCFVDDAPPRDQIIPPLHCPVHYGCEVSVS